MCSNLKKVIEGLLKKGKLQQYKAGTREVGTIETCGQDRINVYKIINMIHGCAHIDQLTNKVKKQCLN